MNCPNCSYPANAGQTTCQHCGCSLVPLPMIGYPAPAGLGVPARQPGAVGELSVATACVFGVVALVSLVDAGLRLGDAGQAALFSIPSALVRIAIIPLFLVWFYKVRANAGLWEHQRLTQGWSIGAWFVPIMWLWSPYQIAKGVWIASMPADSPKRGHGLVRAWWACWLLSWATGFHTIRTYGTGSESGYVSTRYLISLGGTTVSDIFCVLAAVLAAVMVLRIGRAQEARRSAVFVLR